ncbi:hypothetical protein FSP39_004955 [Pinctada imbricata]|uniref:Uncharacterized protein n=1 Tax=Pinctada imbricata TaxID=66713 RepID=A0AA88Y2P8_PINIB|nr:hypothetical protein FSP39_004955 [Pinctada imbricata]
MAASRLYQFMIRTVEPHVPNKLLPLWHHPAGPKTIFFWCPFAKWVLVFAGIGDLTRPAEKLSLFQSTALLSGNITKMADVLRSIFIFPFTAGHSRSGNFLQDDRDAKISSAVLMSSLISVSVSCTLIFGILTTDNPHVPDNFLWAFYCLKNVLSFFCVVALCLVLYKNRHYLTEQKVDYALSRKIIFLWIFGLGFLLKDAINITINASCAANASTVGERHLFDGDYTLADETRNDGYQEINTNRRPSYDNSYDDDYYARESDRLLNSINCSIETRADRPKSMSFFLSIAAGLIMSIPLLVVTMIMSRKFGEKHAIPVNAYRTVEAIFNVCLLIVVCFGFHSLRMQCREYRKKPITSAEWLLIFSNFGLGMCRTFNIAAFFLSKEPHSAMDTFVFCRHFVVFINSFWQTILIVQAGRYRKLHRTNRVSRISVENCFMVLHILNFMLWFISIFTIKDLTMASPDERNVYGKQVWDNFLKILWPINVFYCFHSSMDHYGLYRRFDKRSD